MKKLILSALCILSIMWASSSFAQTTKTPEDVYSFTTNKGNVAPVFLEIETQKIAINTDDIAENTDALLVDAQTLIRDKLVEKYQVRLDKVMEQLTKKLAGVSADIQRKALTEVQGRIAEKKTLVLAKKDIDPLKREVTVAILDHIMFRLDGLIQQSAQQTVINPTV